ncbi:MAG: filamentous hemagglutinin N-terminal domain-containing protein [Symploca sp. SIO2E9]|nr:filamentous hemagglutinin N-terminal domain-containing protein [Symploca sp. SIO2E9]
MIANTSNQYLPGKSWVLTAFVLSGATLVTRESVLAQIIPDNTLDQENSVVTPLNQKVDRIDGGAIRGTNLFHSFQNFSIPEGSGVYFSNPAGVETIFSRVIGSNTSDIYGTLGVLGDANLFLLNPNGILFGPNASLDLKGSFVASTANSVTFPEGSTFSATNPEAPPLLMVNVTAPIGLQFEGEQPGTIVNGGNLEVEAGQNLTLAGGTVVSTGELLAPSGEIAVVAVPGVGADVEMSVVQLEQSGQMLSQEIKPLPPDSSPVSLSAVSLPEVIMEWGENTGVTVSSEGQVKLAESGLPIEAGDVTVRRLNAQTATLSATENLTLVESQLATVGDMQLLAKDTVLLRDSEENPFIAAAGGELLVQGARGVDIFGLNHRDSGLFSIGLQGDITLKSDEAISITNSLVSTSSENYTNVLGLKGGDINIIAENLSLTNGALLFTSALGQVDAGNVNINVRDTVTIDGENDLGRVSGVLSTLEKGAIGQSGNIQIEAESLRIQNGAQITTITFGQGDSGKISLRANGSVVLDGSKNTNLPTRVISVVTPEAVGNSNGIEIFAESLTLRNGAYVSTSTFGQGDAGTIDVNVREAVTLEGFTPIMFNGIDLIRFNNVLLTQVGLGAIGEAGDISIKARSLSLSDASVIESSTLSQGNAGDIRVQVDEFVSLDQSNIGSSVILGGVGSGGDIDIWARSLTLTNGAQIGAAIGQELSNRPGGSGKGGNIRVNTTDFVSISGVTPAQLIFTPSEIRQLEGFSSGLLVAAERGTTGSAGSIIVNTGAFRLADGGVVEAFTGNSSKAGDITINANTFEATGGGQLLATTFSSGRAGDITLDINDSITISGSDPTFTDRMARFGENVVSNQGSESGLFANTTPSSTGNGGRIFIDSRTAKIQNGGRVAVNSQGSGLAGDIEVAVGSILLKNQGEISAETFSSRGGNIRLRNLNTLQVNNGEISASTTTGRAGSLSINANEEPARFVELAGEGGLLVEATEGGTAGSLFIKTQELSISDEAQVTVSSPQGQAGNINIAADSVSMNQGRITAETGEGTGEGGANITLQLSQNLTLSNESLISAEAFNNAKGGNVTIDGRFLIALPPEEANGSDIIAKAFEGNGGRISIDALGIFGIEERRAIPGNGTNDIDASSDFGAPGVVELNTLFDPTGSLTNLPDEPRSTDVAEGCQASDGQDTVQFYDIGKGGSPPPPDEPLNADTLITEWIPLDSKTAEEGRKERAIAPNTEAIRAAHTPTTTPDLMPPCQNR